MIAADWIGPVATALLVALAVAWIHPVSRAVLVRIGDAVGYAAAAIAGAAVIGWIMLTYRRPPPTRTPAGSRSEPVRDRAVAEAERDAARSEARTTAAVHDPDAGAGWGAIDEEEAALRRRH